MRSLAILLTSLALVPSLGRAATFGTVTPVVGGVVDIVLDAPRQRLYLVGVPDKVIVYSIAQRRVLSEIRTDSLPLAAAMSRDGKTLYVSAHNASSLNIIDLESLGVTGRVTLPARPEGVAVGGDGQVLITTIGTGQNNAFNVLLRYNPAATESNALSSVTVAPPPPASPVLPAPQGQILRAVRSFLVPTPDGQTIIGVNIPNATQRSVFVYEVASGAVLRSRTVANLSSVLSVAADGRRFMAGLTLFDTASLEVLAQQNLANSPYPIPNNTNFNLQQNQGGSVFSPDGSTLYSAFNVAPTQNPPARANTSQLMLNDPENLLIRSGIQLPENLSGKIVITPDSQNMFAISESGFLTIPIGTLNQQPLVSLSATSALVANDQCGAVGDLRTTTVQARNEGRGTLGAVTAQPLQQGNVIPGLGGAGGPGGGIVIPIPGPGGGGIIIPIGGGPGGGAIPGQPGGGGGQQPGGAATATAPVLQQRPAGAAGTDFVFTFNQANRNAVGTVNPFHDYVIQSPNAVNIPAQVRVFQNNRDSDARGQIVPMQVGISASEGLTDLVYDPQRQRLYITNSGLNRLEVFDIRQQRLLAPIKVGQLPRSMALSLDGSLLYVANSGGESLSIVDLDRRETVGRLRFPPLPFNSGTALVLPSQVVMTLAGPLVVANNGTIWRAVGDELVPRRLEPEIFGTATTIGGPRSMAATPNGEFAIIFSTANGTAYLYSALDDRFVQSRQIATPQQLTSYVGAIAAGPRGAYYIINNIVLNSALSPTNSATVTIGTASTTLPVASVTPLGASTFARFTQQARTAANQPLTTPGTVEIVDVNTGVVSRRANSLEGPATIPVGNQRVAIDSRLMAVDATGTVSYVVTSSGISIIPLDTPAVADRPTPNQGGIVSATSLLPSFAPGSWVSIYGRNLGQADAARGLPYPTVLGGVCVTLNNSPIPLAVTSAGQINALIPSDLSVTAAAGVTQSLVIRSLDRRLSSVAQNIRITRVAPAVVVDGSGKAAVFDAQSGKQVTRENPTTRDRWLTIYATGLGTRFEKNARVASGAAPTEPLELADTVEVFFGEPTDSRAEMDVRWAGLIPGFVGLYQINLYVPWYRIRGDAVPVTIRLNGVSSQQSGPARPAIAIE